MSGQNSTPVTLEEQTEIDSVRFDGRGWSLRSEMPEDVRDCLKTKGMIRFQDNRWRLTPAGFAASIMSDGREPIAHLA